MKKFKRGDKHPTKNLIFWQYHHPYHKDTNGEVWYTTEMFNEKHIKHLFSSNIHRRKYPLLIMVKNAIQRDMQKYNTIQSDLIDLEFIEKLVEKQNNKCYWFNIEMETDYWVNTDIINPKKISIDRLDCSKGYSKDNVVLASYAANCGRNNCPDDMWKIIVNEIKNGLNEQGN